jgi:hypothetical protein
VATSEKVTVPVAPGTVTETLEPGALTVVLGLAADSTTGELPETGPTGAMGVAIGAGETALAAFT